MVDSRSIDHIAIAFDMHEAQDSVDDVVLYWWANDVLYKEIAAKVDNLENIGRLRMYAVL
jgi:hypothetical protein